MQWYMIIPGGQESFSRDRVWVVELVKNHLPADTIIIEYAQDLKPIRGGAIVFCLSVGETGILPEWTMMLHKIRMDDHFFEGSLATVVVDGSGELYTKQVGRELVFSCNQAGCIFPGRPLTEGTGSLNNYQVNAKNWGTTLEEAYRRSVLEMLDRQKDFSFHRKDRPRLLVLHASIRKTSNTMRLWNMVKDQLEDCMDITEISLRNGEICDCGGCPFTMCMHYSEKGQCYYGGVIVEQVYPSVENCDGLLLLCPNYNDAVSANISAFINRLTALYRKRQFFDKCLFGIIVSGYSGGDILARQLISSLNMNKTFTLPAHFAMMETANDPGSIMRVEGIEEEAKAFARGMMWALLKDDSNSTM